MDTSSQDQHEGATTIRFDEGLYLRRYIDVARAKQRGDIKSGLDHFLRSGLAEGRAWKPVDRHHQDLMLNCCSLGQDCEFGVIQSIFDAHPLDLFRWSGLPSKSLSVLLQNRFRDLNNLDCLSVSASLDNEWDITNATYGVKWHTFVSTENVSRDIIAKREAARLKWLSDKLLADLQRGTRLFVRVGSRDQPEDGLEFLGLLHEYNSQNRLLWVRPADPSNGHGSANRTDTGLTIGYLDAFWRMDQTRDTWLAMCLMAAH